MHHYRCVRFWTHERRLSPANAQNGFDAERSWGRIGATMREEFQHREDLAHFGRLIHQQGFVSACDGNLSVRLDSNTILATPTSVSKGMMQPSDMVKVDMQG